MSAKAEKRATKLRRRILSRLGTAVAGMETDRGEDGVPPDDSVHQARKAIKWVRGVLRALGKKGFPAECDAIEAGLQTAAHALAPLRDDAVRQRTIDRILGRTAPGAEAGKPSTGAQRTGAKVAVQSLTECIDLIAAEPVLPLRRKSLKKAIQRAKRRARKQGQATMVAPGTETLHAWRKRLKQYEAALQIPGAGKRRKRQKELQAAKRLTDLLGEDHDYAIALEQIGPDQHRVLEKIQELRAALLVQLRQHIT